MMMPRMIFLIIFRGAFASKKTNSLISGSTEVYHDSEAETEVEHCHDPGYTENFFLHKIFSMTNHKCSSIMTKCFLPQMTILFSFNFHHFDNDH